jgi:hypothetical protein
MPLVFIGVNKVEMLVQLLLHVGWREFLAWDGQIGPVMLGPVWLFSWDLLCLIVTLVSPP